MHLDVCLYVENFVLLGLDWVEPMMQLILARHMFMHFFHAYVPFFLFLSFLCYDCSISLPFSLSLG